MSVKKQKVNGIFSFFFWQYILDSEIIKLIFAFLKLHSSLISEGYTFEPKQLLFHLVSLFEKDSLAFVFFSPAQL